MPARPALAVVAGLFLAGCGGSASSDAGASPRVVASIAWIADLASRVAKGRGTVTILVPPGANAHTYQPKPSDARQLAKADLFLDNGLGLNEAITGFAKENLPAKATTVFVAETAVAQSELIAAPQSCHSGCHQGLNPHPWLDPRHAGWWPTPGAS